MEKQQRRQIHKVGYTDLMPFHIWLDIVEFNKLRNDSEHMARLENGRWSDWVEYHNRWGHCLGLPTLASLLFTQNLKRAVFERRLMEKECSEHYLNANKSLMQKLKRNSVLNVFPILPRSVEMEDGDDFDVDNTMSGP